MIPLSECTESVGELDLKGLRETANQLVCAGFAGNQAFEKVSPKFNKC